MRIDSTHRPWFIFSLTVIALAGAWYAWDVTRGPRALNGPSGASLPGLVFGTLGSLFMLFAGLLSGRKRVRTWRLGSAQFWMRGHLWLGAVALPLIWLHGGFRHGGTLTSVLMWLLYAIVLSGLIGAILQHVLPRQMTQSVDGETVYEQIPQVLEHLAAEADHVAAVCGPNNGDEVGAWRVASEAAIEARYQRSLLTAARRDRLVARLRAAPLEGSSALKSFYQSDVRPFIAGSGGSGRARARARAGAASAPGVLLADAGRAASLFAQQRLALPRALHESLGELEQLCDRARALRRQQRMHRWLHGWLLVHVPLSAALLVLGAIHVVVSLRYSF